MGRYDEMYENEDPFPNGIPLNQLIDELLECQPNEIEKPSIPNLQALISAESISAYTKNRYEDDDGKSHFKWEEGWHYLPANLFDHFTTDEKCRLLFNSRYCSELGDMMLANPRYRIFRKINNCLWRWGWDTNYNLFVRAYNALRQFDFGIEGFDTYLDHTTYHNERGYSQYNRKWLDGVFSYMIYYKGEHVMTIGFSVSCYGLLIQQIQLVKPKGNRWLYKLPCHYLEHAVNQLAKAFDGWRLLFVDGGWLAESIRRSYGKNGDKFTDEKYNHVVKVYSQRFKAYKRAGWRRVLNHRFHYLHLKQVA